MGPAWWATGAVLAESLNEKLVVSAPNKSRDLTFCTLPCLLGAASWSGSARECRTDKHADPSSSKWRSEGR